MSWHARFAASGSVTSITGCCTTGSLDFHTATGYSSIPDLKPGARQLPIFTPIRRSPCVALRHAGIARRSITGFAVRTTACCGDGWLILNSIRCFELGTTTMQIGVGGDRQAAIGAWQYLERQMVFRYRQVRHRLGAGVPNLSSAGVAGAFNCGLYSGGRQRPDL
jgi:hypothetical protein